MDWNKLNFRGTKADWVFLMINKLTRILKWKWPAAPARIESAKLIHTENVAQTTTIEGPMKKRQSSKGKLQ